MTSVGTGILGNSTFVNRSSVTSGSILPVLNYSEKSDIPESMELSAIIIILLHIMPSEWLSAESTIRAFKGHFRI